MTRRSQPNASPLAGCRRENDDDVSAQLEQRVERSHGTNFDRLVRKAREQSNGDGLGTAAEIDALDLSERPTADAQDSASQSDSSGMARGGLEPPTPRFSVVCSTNWATSPRRAILAVERHPSGSDAADR
jgi:hypothetical protein